MADSIEKQLTDAEAKAKKKAENIRAKKEKKNLAKSRPDTTDGKDTNAAAAATAGLNSTPIPNNSDREGRKRSRAAGSPTGFTPKDKLSLLDEKEGEETLGDDVDDGLLDDSDPDETPEVDVEAERRRMEKLETEEQKDDDHDKDSIDDTGINDDENMDDSGRAGPAPGMLMTNGPDGYARAAAPCPSSSSEERTELKVLGGPSGNNITHEEFATIRDNLNRALVNESIMGNTIRNNMIEKAVYSGRGKKKYACVVVHSKAAENFVRNAIATMKFRPYTVWGPEAFNSLVDVFHFEVIIRGFEDITSDNLAVAILRFNEIDGQWKRIKTDNILKRARGGVRQRRLKLEADDELLYNLRRRERRPEDRRELWLPPNNIPLKLGLDDIDLVPVNPRF